MHLFVTGTDTGVGKTAVTTALALAASRRRIRALPAKPIQTGASERSPSGIAPDLVIVLDALGLPYDPTRCCVLLPLPASPHLAAAEAGIEIDLPAVVQRMRELEAVSPVIAEGAGGVLVPLNARETMLDLMQALDYPVLLVARSGLGTLNHSLLSLQALQQAGLRCRGFVTVDVEPPPDDATSRIIATDNARTISNRSGVPHLGHLPHLPTWDSQALESFGLSIFDVLWETVDA